MWTGKSCLLNILNDNYFEKNYVKTICVDYRKKTYKNMIINYWDLSGDPKYENLILRYFNNTDIILLVYNCYDVNDSFEFIKNFYNENIDSLYYTKIIIVGNKYDLYNNSYNKNILLEFCEEKNIQHFYTSCKTKYGIKNLIKFFLDDYLEKITEYEDIKINLNENYKCNIKCCNIL